MPLNKNGLVINEVRGKTPQAMLQNEIQEMRRELRRMESILMTLEMQARSAGNFPSNPDGQGAPALHAAMQQQFSSLFNWYLSAMESFVSMSWVVFGKAKTRDVVLDFMRRFQPWSKPL